MELLIDQKRLNLGPTGIFVRARGPDGSWGSFDIAALDSVSLHEWLRSRNGKNVWAESVVAVMLGHDHTVAPWAMPEAPRVGDKIVIINRPEGCTNDKLIGKEAVVVAISEDGQYATIAVQVEFQEDSGNFNMWVFQALDLFAKDS